MKCNWRKFAGIMLMGVMMVSLSCTAFARSLAPKSYTNVGTGYQWQYSVVSNTSGVTLSVNTRPTTTTAAKIKIYNDKVTYAEGTFPYQTRRNPMKTTMKKNKTYKVALRAASGKVSGSISGKVE